MMKHKKASYPSEVKAALVTEHPAPFFLPW